MCLCLIQYLWSFVVFLGKLSNKLMIRMLGKRPDGRSPDGKKLEKQTFVVFDPTLTGMQGYNTFRIPAVVSFQKWIFAFCEGRRDTHEDYGSIDIILRRAQISGKDKTLEWDKDLIVVAEATKKYRFMNPCPVIDKDGNILIVYASFPLNELEKDLIVGGKCDQQLFCRKSEDNGATWQDPIDMTYIFKEFIPEPLIYAPGPGHCILAKSGRIILSGNVQYKKKLRRLTAFLSKHLAPFYGSIGKTCIIFSDDGGKTWKAGTEVESATYKPFLIPGYKKHVHGNESQLAEISDNEFYVNSRTKEPTKNRQSVVINSSGNVLKPAELTDLYEPSKIPRLISWFIPNFLQCGGCEGSVLSLVPEGYSDCQLLIFSNPANRRSRKNLSVRVSKDRGRKWSEPLTLHSGPAAYSDLVTVTNFGDEGEEKETQIGCLYECGERGEYEASRIVLDLFSENELKECKFKEDEEMHRTPSNQPLL